MGGRFKKKKRRLSLYVKFWFPESLIHMYSGSLAFPVHYFPLAYPPWRVVFWEHQSMVRRYVPHTAAADHTINRVWKYQMLKLASFCNTRCNFTGTAKFTHTAIMQATLLRPNANDWMQRWCRKEQRDQGDSVPITVLKLKLNTPPAITALLP